jgi:hypothetical protein
MAGRRLAARRSSGWGQAMRRRWGWPAEASTKEGGWGSVAHRGEMNSGAALALRWRCRRPPAVARSCTWEGGVSRYGSGVAWRGNREQRRAMGAAHRQRGRRADCNGGDGREKTMSEPGWLLCRQLGDREHCPGQPIGARHWVTGSLPGGPHRQQF